MAKTRSESSCQQRVRRQTVRPPPGRREPGFAGFPDREAGPGSGPKRSYLPITGRLVPSPTDEIFDRAADSLERWHRSFLKREQTEQREGTSPRQFSACLEASLEPIAFGSPRPPGGQPAWLNLARALRRQARLNGRLGPTLPEP